MAEALPRAVLLDLDDTILDDTGSVLTSWRDACAVHRSDMNGVDPDVVFEAIDRIREWYWSDPERHRIGRLELAWARGEVVRLALAEIGVDDPELARAIGNTYHALRDRGIKPFDDSVATVRWLREQGCRLALLTNGGSRGSGTRSIDSILRRCSTRFSSRVKSDSASPIHASTARRSRCWASRRITHGWSATTSSGMLPARSARASRASGSTRGAAACHRDTPSGRIESSVGWRN